MFDFVKNIFKTREKEVWEVIATCKNEIAWTYTKTGKKHSDDVITWYLEQSNLGNRRYYFHSYGETKSHKKEQAYEARLILWQKTGILPEDAEAIDFTAMKNAANK